MCQAESDIASNADVKPHYIWLLPRYKMSNGLLSFQAYNYAEDCTAMKYSNLIKGTFKKKSYSNFKCPIS